MSKTKLVLKSSTPLSTAYTPWGQDPGIMGLIFAVFDSWGIFTQNIFPGEKIVWKAVPKVWQSDLKKLLFFHFE